DQTENISNARVYDEMTNINEMFRNVGFYDPSIGADARIQFCMAQVAPDGTSTSGINRYETSFSELDLTNGDDFAFKQIYNWDPTQYLNVYVVRSIRINGGFALGYAYYPLSAGEFWDGIVLRYSTVGGSKAGTATFGHEIGHYLGLPHPFDRGCDNGDCFLFGDRVCDTPPDNSTFEGCGYSNSCSTDADDPSSNNPFTTDEEDLNDLYMDYNPDDCAKRFTPGQVERMRIVLRNLRSSLLQSNVCHIPALHDAGITAIESPSRTECIAPNTVEVSIKNFGILPLTQANISYQIDQGNVNTIGWAGNIAPSQSQTFSFTLNGALSQGTRNIRVYTEFPNGQTDGFANNDSSQRIVNIGTTGNFPLFESFVNGIPGNWTINNQEGLGWQLESLGCDDGQNRNAMMLDNTFIYNVGVDDGFLTPEIDLSNISDAVLRFDYAFPYDLASILRNNPNQLGNVRERFSVLVSKDCGKTYDSDPLFSGSDTIQSFATAIINSDSIGLWEPSCADWRTVEIDLSSLVGETVLFDFQYQKFFNGFPIYLDNINITSASVTAVEADVLPSITIFPNPAQGETVQLSVKNPQRKAYHLRLFQTTGQQIWSVDEAKSAIREQHALPTAQLAAGIYFLQMEMDGQTINKKLIIR
ncbi:MAG: M43 family zinc metalloprotease, partial [Bacteroidota bacterium]